MSASSHDVSRTHVAPSTLQELSEDVKTRYTSWTPNASDL